MERIRSLSSEPPLLRLRDLLATSRISRIGPELASSKFEVLALMAKFLATPLFVNDEIIRDALLARENEQTTAIGDGVAFPHAHLRDLDAPLAALFILPSGVSFDALDGGDVTVVLGLVGPVQTAARQMKLLARWSRILSNHALREELVKTESPSELLELLGGTEGGA